MEKKGATPEPLITSTPLCDTLPPPFLHFLAPQPSVPEMGAEQAHRGAVGIPSPYASLPLMAKGIYAGTRRGSFKSPVNSPVHTLQVPGPLGRGFGLHYLSKGLYGQPRPWGPFPHYLPLSPRRGEGEGLSVNIKVVVVVVLNKMEKHK